MPLVGVNHLQPILHISKRMVHCYSTDEIINQFSFGYMISPSLKFDKVFREQVEKCWSVSFHKIELKTIKDCLKKYKVLSCVVYSLIENYILIDYLSCQSKTLSSVSSEPKF